MGVLKKIISRILLPKHSKFSDDFTRAFSNSLKEIEAFDESLKDLCITWLIVDPSQYFITLFLEGNEDFIKPFVAAFDKSDMLNAQDCYTITQAYFLRHLKQMIIQDPQYHKFPVKSIDTNILIHMTFGQKILKIAKEFEQRINSMGSIDDLTMCYVEKILETQYSNKIAKDACITSLWLDKFSLFGLTTFFNEFIKTTKLIDKKGNVL